MTSSTEGLRAQVLLQDGEHEFTADHWTSVDTLTGKLHIILRCNDLDDIIALSVENDDNGTLSGSFGAFAVEGERNIWNEDQPADEYAGCYTIALSPYDGTSPFQGTGWLRMTVLASDGSVALQGMLPDGTAIASRAFVRNVVSDGNMLLGRIFFFSPLDDGIGFVAGSLDLLPLSSRNEEEASISSCELAIAWHDGQRLCGLEPCGASYYPGVSLGEQIDEADYGNELFFMAGYPKNLTVNGLHAVSASLPNAVRIIDQADDSFETDPAYLPAYLVDYGRPDPITGMPWADGANLVLAYDRDLGIFQGQFTIRFPTSDGSFEDRIVQCQGVLTPIPGSCCREDPMPAGQGFYLVEAEDGAWYSYPVTIRPDNPLAMDYWWYDLKTKVTYDLELARPVFHVTEDGQGVQLSCLQEEAQIFYAVNDAPQGFAAALYKDGEILPLTAMETVTAWACLDFLTGPSTVLTVLPPPQVVGIQAADGQDKSLDINVFEVTDFPLAVTTALPTEAATLWVDGVAQADNGFTLATPGNVSLSCSLEDEWEQGRQYAPSPNVTMTVCVADEEFTYGAEGTMALTVGWNLVGIPLELTEVSEQEILSKYLVFGMDDHGNWVRPARLTVGGAYWIWMEAPLEPVVLRGTRPGRQKLNDGRLEWRLGDAEDHCGTWRWQDGRYVWSEEPQPEGTGVWFHE
jgi:hypothetical protein